MTIQQTHILPTPSPILIAASDTGVSRGAGRFFFSAQYISPVAASVPTGSKSGSRRTFARRPGATRFYKSSRNYLSTNSPATAVAALDAITDTHPRRESMNQITAESIAAMPEPAPQGQSKSVTVNVEGYPVAVNSCAPYYASARLWVDPVNPELGAETIALSVTIHARDHYGSPEFINEINQCVMRVVEAAKAIGVKPQAEAA